MAANVFRRLTGAKMGKSSHRTSKDQNINEVVKNNALSKERDKLLQEFLLAREELKGQFDLEKKEIITNYERRLKYLRKLIEEYDENMNMLKLNLDAEKEENFISRTKILEQQNEVNKLKMKTQGYQNESYEDESTLEMCYKENETDQTSPGTLYSEDIFKYEQISQNTYEKQKNFKSDQLSNCLKCSCRNSIDSISKSSFTSITTTSTGTNSTLSEFYCNRNNEDGLHSNCRKEFCRLLEELRIQETKFEEKLQKEKDIMMEQIENERLQLEKIVYKQLKLKLEKEVKKHEFLNTENAHLRKTINNTVIDSLMNQLRSKQLPRNHEEWKETNSDSGADVEYNKSDDESDTTSQTHVSRQSSNDSMFSKKVYFGEDDAISSSAISSILNEQQNRLANEFEKQFLREKKRSKLVTDNLNCEILTLMLENKKLKDQISMGNDCYQNVTEFHSELTEKLFNLQDILVNNHDAV